MENQTARTAKQVEQGVATRIQQRSQRPAENGTHPGGAAEMKVDVAHMTRQQRKELARRHSAENALCCERFPARRMRER